MICDKVSYIKKATIQALIQMSDIKDDGILVICLHHVK